jgi:hypothetical protein
MSERKKIISFLSPESFIQETKIIFLIVTYCKSNFSSLGNSVNVAERGPYSHCMGVTVVSTWKLQGCARRVSTTEFKPQGVEGFREDAKGLVWLVVFLMGGKSHSHAELGGKLNGRGEYFIN